MIKDSSERKLNKSQIEAIEHGEGSLLIIAGAGTGKTTVITERIKNLIREGLAKPEEILALTFTEKATKEMQERVDIAMPLSYGDMWIMTFHSFCDRILRDYALEIGLPTNFKLMTTAESIDLIRKNLFDFDLDYFRPLGNPNKFIDALLTHFSRLQDEVITTEEYLSFSKKYKNEDVLEIIKIKELSAAYSFYDQLKIKEGKFDFGDLITKTLELFSKRPNVLKEIQKKFKYILIDEFQDTNYAQNKLAIALAGKTQNITVVADDDQSIYRFRGASVSNVLQFKKNFKHVKEIVLSKNYRSRQEILDVSYNLIQFNNPDRLEVVSGINKKLVASCKFEKLKDPIKFIKTNTGDREAEQVVKEIVQLTKKNKYKYSDIAILVRANNHADPFIREMEREGIPHQFLGPSKLFEKPEIVDLISYLKVLNDPDSSEAFYRLLSSEIFSIDSLTLLRLSTRAKKKSQSLFEASLESNDPAIKKLMGIVAGHFKLIKSETAGFILFDYIKQIGLNEKLIKEEDLAKANNISKFFEKLKTYENLNKNSGVSAIVDYLELLMEVGDAPIVNEAEWSTQDAVNVLTVHSSKGLEFKAVFLVNLVSLRFPSMERHEAIPIPDALIKETLPSGDFHMQEERRLFYVGMTRAKDRLYLTAAEMYGDAKRAKKVSQFVYEALGKLAISSKPYAVSYKKDVYANKTIHHKAYGVKHEVNFLSISQIETFQTCPMHYKLRYIYKISASPLASSSFGVSIHNTLKDFFEQKTEILKLYKNNWVEEGYENKKHKLEFFKKGESYLLGFVKNSYDPKINTLALEQKFNFKLNGELKIGGTIDRVDDIVGGGIEIVDYKTSANIPTQKDVDKNLQLSVYALAASEIYKIKPEDIKLSLYYLDTQEKFSTKRTVSDLEKVKEEILKVKDEIEKSDFKCSNHYFCQKGCEYSMFCKES